MTRDHPVHPTWASQNTLTSYLSGDGGRGAKRDRGQRAARRATEATGHMTDDSEVNDRSGRGAAPDGFVTDGGAQERRERRAQTDRQTEKKENNGCRSRRE